MATWNRLAVILLLVAGCEAPLPEAQRGSVGADYAQLTEVSQAPYRYRRMTYWALANGCTYSPGTVYGGGLRWFLVKDPISPDQAMVYDGCTYMFDAAPGG